MVEERRAEIAWLVGAADVAQLRRDGYRVVSFSSLRRDFIEPARDPGRELSVENPAQPLLQLFERCPRIAITGVPTLRNGDIRDLYGYIVEPAWRRGVNLQLYADRSLKELGREELIEPDVGYPWTLERLQFLLVRAQRREFEPGLPPLTPIEHRLFRAMRAEGLAPVAEYGVGRFRVDFAFPDVQLAVEADGREWHEPERDRRRDHELGMQGWAVERFTGSEIVADAARCAVAVAATIAQLNTRVSYSPLAEEPRPRRRVLASLLQWIFRILWRDRTADDVNVDWETPPDAAPTPWRTDLDEGQSAAVRAHGGVVQALAPAGSGKTTVLIARVQELISRGVPASSTLLHLQQGCYGGAPRRGFAVSHPKRSSQRASTGSATRSSRNTSVYEPTFAR